MKVAWPVEMFLHLVKYYPILLAQKFSVSFTYQHAPGFSRQIKKYITRLIVYISVVSPFQIKYLTRVL